MRLYSAYLFDLDGTLVDTLPDILQAANVALQDDGFAAIDLALGRRFVGQGGRVLLQGALASQGVETLNAERSERLYQAFLSHYDEQIAAASVAYPGVHKTLAHLQGLGIPLAVITNKIEALSRKLLTTLDMMRYFDVLVGLDSLPERKPHPLPVQHVCERFGVRPSESLFVGDSVTDVVTARAAGCDVVCVDYGYHGEIAPHRLGADAVLSDFTEIL